MRTPIQLRLTVITLIVLLLGMGVAAILSWSAVEELFISTQRENLLAQARWTASALGGIPLPDSLSEPYMQTVNIQPGIHTRLLDEQGAVLVNVPLVDENRMVQVPQAENTGHVSTEMLLNRPEIQSALNGTASTAIRKVSSANNRRVLYAAAPVLDENGLIAGLAYLATPLPPASLPLFVIFQLVGAVLAAVLLASFVGMLLSRRIALPLEQLSQAAEAVSEGNLDQHIPADNKIQELQRLGEAFNQMTNSLHQSNQAKNAFIADVTHELRTPLTVIQGTIETLEDGAFDDLEGRGPLLESMKRETERLIRLVNNLLLLTRAEAGALNMQFISIDMISLTHTRCEALSALAGSKKIYFQTESRGNPFAYGDPDRLSQVLDNLLDNAIRYAPTQSKVIIRIENHDDRVYCTIIDEGPGIPEIHLPLIFERFYRADTARDRQCGGAGLGLAIVRSLVEAHGGRVSAVNTPNRGAAIGFWIPACHNCNPTA